MTNLLSSLDSNVKSSIVLDSGWPFVDHVTVGGGVPERKRKLH